MQAFNRKMRSWRANYKGDHKVADMPQDILAGIQV